MLLLGRRVCRVSMRKGNQMFTKEISARGKFFVGAAASVGAMLLLASSRLLRSNGAVLDGFTERFAQVNGVRLHYLIGWRRYTGGPAARLC
jgi:hypothetical protein